jgi:acyl-coenzyme A synthetase/AMP-(fatty) acid ligase/acyl carrier protein
MLMAFGAGAGLHLVPRDKGMPDLAALLDQWQITAVMLTPSAMAAVAHEAPLPALRTVTVGGEACPPALAAHWSAGRRFFNFYGPTEATILSTYHEVTSVTGAVPIGRPLPGVSAHVMDEWMRLVPVGVPGELCVGGDVVARGYLGRPARTAERFVPDPVGRLPGRRLYRTGDLVRRRPDGALEFLGRLDDQVKIRGFRIELGEVENVLGGHRAVREAAAALHEIAPGSPEIVGYVVTHSGSTPREAELRELCAQSLPHYMVPARVVVLDRLPTNAGGKVDRRALPAPERSSTGATAAPPRSPRGELIARAWAEVLGSDGVGHHDDFFDLGGNSLSATQVVIRLRRELGVEIPVRLLFDNPELGMFASAVDAVVAGER